MRVARFRVVRFRPAQFFAADVFSRDGLDDRRTRDVHDSRFRDHEDVVRERRAVDRSAGRRTEDDRDLRDDSARDGVPVEDFPVAVQAVDRFLDPRSAGVVDSYDRASRFERHVHDFADFLRVHFPERSAQNREVLAVHEDPPPVYRSAARDDSVSRVFLVPEAEGLAPVRDVFVDFHKAPRIQQPLYPLPRRPFPLLVLLPNRLLPSAPPRFLPLPHYLFAEFFYPPLRHRTIPLPNCGKYVERIVSDTAYGSISLFSNACRTSPVRISDQEDSIKLDIFLKRILSTS